MFPTPMQFCTDLQHPDIRPILGIMISFSPGWSYPGGANLRCPGFVNLANEEQGQTTGFLRACLPELTKAHLPLVRVFPSHRHRSFRPGGPRNPSPRLENGPARLPGQAAQATDSWLPSVLDPPHLGLGTSPRGWIQRKRELLPLLFSLAPPGLLPNEIKEAALVTKQHSGRRRFAFKGPGDAHTMSEGAPGSRARR